MLGRPVNFESEDGGTDFVINDRTNQPLLHGQSPFYYIQLRNVDGLRSSDISYESHPIPNLPGEKSGDVFRRGKTITLSGNIYALNFGYLEQGAYFLDSMFAETGLRKLLWTPIFDPIEIYIKCRVVQDVSVIESVDDGLYRWPWIVGLRADNPFTYKSSDNSLYPTFQQ